MPKKVYLCQKKPKIKIPTTLKKGGLRKSPLTFPSGKMTNFWPLVTKISINLPTYYLASWKMINFYKNCFLSFKSPPPLLWCSIPSAKNNSYFFSKRLSPSRPFYHNQSMVLQSRPCKIDRDGVELFKKK